MTRVAVIGGGLTGISCALRLAEHGVETHLFESAPKLGGRTRSFYDRKTDTWVDNGPHLLIGAYKHARDFFTHHGVEEITWQSSLCLPLWTADRGHFSLNPKRTMPLSLSLAWGVSRLPSHGMKTLLAMLRLGTALRRKIPKEAQVAEWLHELNIPIALQRDLLIPLCLGAMNEPAESAPAISFARVLSEAFANHDSARLGWFSRPFEQSLITPLERALRRHGVSIHLSNRITALRLHDRNPGLVTRSGEALKFDYIVLSLPAYARNRLIGLSAEIRTRPITNVHMWFDEDLHLPYPFVGGIGTLGHWFFDIDQQMPEDAGSYRHFCAVISAEGPRPEQILIEQLCNELSSMLGRNSALRPSHVRMVLEHRATTLVRSSNTQIQLPNCILDAGEYPQIGDLPATIETAIERGHHAADRIFYLGRS